MPSLPPEMLSQLTLSTLSARLFCAESAASASTWIWTNVPRIVRGSCRQPAPAKPSKPPGCRNSCFGRKAALPENHTSVPGGATSASPLLRAALTEAGNRMLGSRPQSTQRVQPLASVSRSGEGQPQRLATTRTPSAATRQLSPGGSDDSTRDRPTGRDHRRLPGFSIGNMGFLYTDAIGGLRGGGRRLATLPFPGRY